MSVKRERTRQQLDPAGATGMRPVAIVTALAAFIYALLLTVLVPQHLVRPVLSGLALFLLAIACYIVISRSSPLKAPLTATSHVLVQLTVLGAATVATAASWGSPRMVYEGWAPISLGLLLLALSSYRPSREIAGSSFLAAIYLGFLIVIEAPQLAMSTPPVSLVIAAVTPMLAMGLGAAAFASTFISALERWHRRAESANKKVTRQMHAGIIRSVQQDRVTILNREVLPFFADILQRSDVTAADRSRAAEIADSIRSVMVAESDRSWLEQVIEQTITEDGVRVADRVSDPLRLAPMIATDQRTALRAFLVALVDEPGIDHHSVHFEFKRRGERCLCVVTALVITADFSVRTMMAPYLAVMRVVFSELHVELSQSKLEIRMSYEQHR